MFAGRDITLTKETSDGKLKTEVDISSSVEGTGNRQFEHTLYMVCPQKENGLYRNIVMPYFYSGDINLDQ